MDSLSCFFSFLKSTFIALSSSFTLVLSVYGFADNPALPSKPPITLIWQFDPENSGTWEGDWIREVLSNVSYTEIVDGKFEVILDNSIIVAVGNDKNIPDYFDKLQKKGYHFGAFFLSDEVYSHPTDCYQYPQLVFRNYWHKKFADQKHVRFFPLGYKNKFWRDCPNKEIKDCAHRKYVWSFAGQIEKTTRVSMITNMRKIENSFVHEIHSWNAANSLSVQEYRNVLLDSVFVPCPRGYWNLDSFRVYEALECGCIPIVEKQPLDYFGKLFGKYPFLAVNSWDEAPALMQNLQKDPVRLEAYRKECYEWWLQYKKDLKAMVANTIEESLSLKTEGSL
jgi:hypothetical protein